VRPGLPDDAAGIARVQVVTWRTAYRSALPAAVAVQLAQLLSSLLAGAAALPMLDRSRPRLA